MSVVPNIAFVFPDSLPQMHTCIQTHTSYHTQRDVSIKLFQEATEQRGDRQSCSQIQVCQRKAVGCCQGWMSILPRNGKRMKKQTLHIVWNSIAWFLCLPLHNNHVRVPDSDGLCAPICAPVCYIDSCVCAVMCTTEFCSFTWHLFVWLCLNNRAAVSAVWWETKKCLISPSTKNNK